MALIMGQYTVASSTVPSLIIPPGPCSVTIWSQAGTVYLGESAAMSSVTGASIPTTPLNFQGLSGSAGKQLYAIGPGIFGYVISTAQ